MHVSVWEYTRATRLVPRLAPYAWHFLRHVALRPYRSDIPRPRVPLAARGAFRVRAAGYDAVLNLILDGYADRSRSRLGRGTGPLVVRLNRLMAAFDDRYEHRLAAGGPTTFDDVFGDDLVQDRLSALTCFLASHPQGSAIRAHLTGRVAGQYSRYHALTACPEIRYDLDRQMELAALESAGIVTSFVYSVALFHGDEPAEGVIDEFAHVGILAKLADDALDFWDDLAAGRTNLLDAILYRYPDERAAVLEAAGRPERRTLDWWKVHCPRSYVDLTKLLAEQRSYVTSPRLGLACDLLLRRTRQGRTVIRPAPAGLRT